MKRVASSGIIDGIDLLGARVSTPLCYEESTRIFGEGEAVEVFSKDYMGRKQWSI